MGVGDEYINRRKVSESINLVISDMKEKAGNDPIQVAAIGLVERTRDYVANFKPEDVAPVVHGRWETDEATGEIYCSNCFENAVFTSGHHYYCGPYCPNCGAKMEKGVSA